MGKASGRPFEVSGSSSHCLCRIIAVLPRIRVQTGERLAIFSDGVTEAEKSGETFRKRTGRSHARIQSQGVERWTNLLEDLARFRIGRSVQRRTTLGPLVGVRTCRTGIPACQSGVSTLTICATSILVARSQTAGILSYLNHKGNARL